MAGHDDRQARLALGLEPLRQPLDTFDVEPLLRLVEDEQLARPYEAVARASRRRWPLERVPGSWPDWATSCTSCSTSSTASSASGRPWARARRSRCSTTDRSGKKSRSSITVARSRRTAGSDSRSRFPQISIVPLSALSAPTRQRRIVDLPAPLRPVSAIASPAQTSRLKSETIACDPYAFESFVTLSTGVRCFAMVPIVPHRARVPCMGPW